MSEFLKTRPFLYDTLRPYQRRLGQRGKVYDSLHAFSLGRGGQVSFIQIGAADGLHNDPIREFIVRDQWRGILVEPLPTVFPRLKKNYAHLDRELRFVNAAISSKDGELTFYTLGGDFLASLNEAQRFKALQKSSFTRAHVERFLARWHPGVTDIVAVTVPCLTVASMLKQHREWLGSPDLLVIDAEGHEPDILGSMDFAEVRPAGIFFEVTSLGARKETLLNHLRDHGYTIQACGGDALAVSV